MKNPPQLHQLGNAILGPRTARLWTILVKDQSSHTVFFEGRRANRYHETEQQFGRLFLSRDPLGTVTSYSVR